MVELKNSETVAAQSSDGMNPVGGAVLWMKGLQLRGT